MNFGCVETLLDKLYFHDYSRLQLMNHCFERHLP